MPEINVNKIPSSLQGIILKSQLYGRAVIIYKKVSKGTVMSPDEAMPTARAFHRCSTLSAITGTYDKFSAILLTKREASKTLKNLESRLDALVCSFNSASLGA